MRCLICDRRLSDYEATIKDKYTGEFKDTCGRCLQETDITPHEELRQLTRFSKLLEELEQEEKDL